LDKFQARHVEAMSAQIEEANTRILECRESDDAKVRASVRGQRVISLSTKHRIRATLRSALTDAVRRPEVAVAVNVASHAQLPSCPRKKPLVWTPDRVRQWKADGTGAGGGDGVDPGSDPDLPDPLPQVPVAVCDVPPHRRQGSPAG
jgi:hypothetical protein